MTADERALLIEQTITAWRPRDRDGRIAPLPAWRDLDEQGRRDAFAAAASSRVVEAALDPEGLSSTAHAVLARIRGAGERP
jgi:hypothetical protein